MTTVDPETLRERVANGENVRIVDIRSEEDYAENHIEGSENRPVRAAVLSGDVEEAVAGLDDVPDDEELVLVCDAGVAATETARLLRERGREASVLDGGLNAWEGERE